MLKTIPAGAAIAPQVVDPSAIGKRTHKPARKTTPRPAKPAVNGIEQKLQEVIEAINRQSTALEGVLEALKSAPVDRSKIAIPYDPQKFRDSVFGPDS